MTLKFDIYYREIIETSDKLYYNYMGINRKEFPKWEGWKIITQYKDQGVDIKEIDDPRLDCLHKNFFYLKFLRG